ncbi:MAG: hypothetical protein JW929_03595 [Anaerolineales bacterium]|nr:hypothetical protein [Anaerolineales bacterium]
MEPLPSSAPIPATPKRGLSTPVIVAITSSVFLSLICCCSSILTLSGFFSPYVIINGEKTYLNNPAGLCCIGAGFVPWLITGILWLVTRQKEG